MLLPGMAVADGTDLANDLVGYWDFNETEFSAVPENAPNQATGASATASDAVFGVDGGFPEWELGPLCGHVHLTGGGNQFFRVEELGAGIANATEITVMCWFKADRNPIVNEPSGLVVTRAATDNLGADRLYGLDITSSLELDGRISDNGVRSTTELYSNNSWHHAAVVYNGTQQIVYLDGVAVETVDKADVTSITSIGELFIGVDPSNTGTRRFSGSIDDVAIFNCAVSGTTIATIATKDASGNPDQDLGQILDPTYTVINNPDTDNDTLCDTWEDFFFGSRSLDQGADDDEEDEDLLTNAEEMNIHFSSPINEDTDGDFLQDGEEVNGTSNPFTDTPGNPSGATSPTLVDTDGDGIEDADELDPDFPDATPFVTNPANADTDFDTFSDADEIANGSDPTDPNDFPDFYNNLIGYWPMDHALGTTAVEKLNYQEGTAAEPSDGEFQNDVGLTWRRSTTAGEGICGYADLSGSAGSFFNIASIGGLVTDDISRFSIVGWVKPRALNNYRGIFMTRSMDPGSNWGLGHYPTAAIDSRVIGLAVTNSAAPTLQADTWAHVAMTDNGIEQKVYLNGVEIASEASRAVDGVFESLDWSIGSDPGNPSRFLNGCVDDFAVFNAGLPASIIAEIYQDGLEGKNLLNSFDSAPPEFKTDDIDEDGMCDQIEIDIFGDITTSDWAEGTDSDGDNLDDIFELDTLKTHPNLKDTDADGLDDDVELSGAENPFKSDKYTEDGAPGSTDPLNPDSDNDTLLDGAEAKGQGQPCPTNPNRTDTDGDAISDPTEINVDGTDPCDPQSAIFPKINVIPISYYNFDEGTGSTAADTATNGTPENATTNQGTIGWDTTDPQIGTGSLDLPGSASMGFDDPFDVGTEAFTISVWIFADTLGNSTNDRKGIVNHREAGNNNGFWGVSTIGDGGTDYRIQGTGGRNVGAGMIEAGEWYHLAITWDADSGTAETFINGKKEQTSTGNATEYTATANMWDIGDDNCCGGREWDGRIDDLAFFDQVLSPGDIQTIHDAGNVGFSIPELIAGEPTPPAEVIEVISVISGSPAENDVTITWDSAGRGDFKISTSPDLENWTEVTPNVPNGGNTTSYTDTGVLPGTAKRFYLIEEVPSAN